MTHGQVPKNAQCAMPNDWHMASAKRALSLGPSLVIGIWSLVNLHRLSASLCTTLHANKGASASASSNRHSAFTWALWP